MFGTVPHRNRAAEKATHLVRLAGAPSVSLIFIPQKGETGMDAMREKYFQNIELLYRQHAAEMVQLAYRRTGDHQTAEALVQEVFLVACYKPT